MNSHFHHDVAVAVVVIVVVVVVELTSSSAFFLLDTGRRLNIFFRFWPRLTSPFRLMGLTECDLKNLGYPTLPRPHLKKTSNITADWGISQCDESHCNRPMWFSLRAYGEGKRACLTEVPSFDRWRPTSNMLWYKLTGAKQQPAFYAFSADGTSGDIDAAPMSTFSHQRMIDRCGMLVPAGGMVVRTAKM